MAMAAPSASAVSLSARPAAAVPGRPRAAVSVGAAVRVPVAKGAAAKGGDWWAPLVGWSGRADYIEPATPVVEGEAEEKRPFVGGRLTEQKARQLRARMVETESFHDAMYHSAIASRLARSAA